MIKWLNQQFLSTQAFYKTTRKLSPWIFALFLVTFSVGVIDGLFYAPADYQQGDGFRIMYVHVPSAFLAMLVYATMALFAIFTLIFRVKVAAMCMSACARIGATFTFLALVTGSIWGKPMWGTWWIWDARLTSVLILFFLYLGFMALESAIEAPEHRERACAILAVVGLINLPIIHYSVVWWNTLHQGPSLSQFAKPTIAAPMLWPLLSMIVAFFLLFLYLLMSKVRLNILKREFKTEWVKVLCHEF